jgi:protein SCO1/2
MDVRRIPRFHIRGFLLGILLIAALAACGGRAPLAGTKLSGDPAPDFTLTDQRGQMVSLSDFRGDAVALTFIYTNCADVCPLIAEHFRAAYASLPARAQDHVALLAVTVDPERDTQQALIDFSKKHGIADNPHWHALTGDRATLEKVWASYYIDSGSSSTTHEHGAQAGTADATPGPEEIQAHTDAIYLIDPKGNSRVLLRSDVDPSTIASNLKQLVD